MVEPLYVFDAYGPGRGNFYADDMHPRMLAWMREQGLNPVAVWRFEVYLIDCPSVRVREYRLAGGVPYCGLEHPHPGGCALAEREPYTVVASSLPPIAVGGALAGSRRSDRPNQNEGGGR